MLPLSLAHKVAIVTGAAQGIGRAIVLKLAEAGCRGVAVFDLRIDDSVTALGRQLESLGAEVLLRQGDVSDRESVKALVDDTVARWGQLDILVNNAGIVVNHDMLTTTEDEWDRSMGINLNPVFYGMRHAVAHMKGNGGGCIINMSSISGVTGGSMGPDYGAAKAAIIGLTKYAARHLARHSNPGERRGAGHDRDAHDREGIRQDGSRGAEAPAEHHPDGKDGLTRGSGDSGRVPGLRTRELRHRGDHHGHGRTEHMTGRPRGSPQLRGRSSPSVDGVRRAEPQKGEVSWHAL